MQKKGTFESHSGSKNGCLTKLPEVGGYFARLQRVNKRYQKMFNYIC